MDESTVYEMLVGYKSIAKRYGRFRIKIIEKKISKSHLNSMADNDFMEGLLPSGGIIKRDRFKYS